MGKYFVIIGATGKKSGGATVHYMSAKIDDGDIIEQGSVDISDCITMFELMKRTKKIRWRIDG